MAAQPKERSAKTAARRKTRGEEELRLHTMAGTRQALADLMAWHGIEEQGEAMTLMIHHLHGLGPAGSAKFLAPPRHETCLSKSVLRDFRMQSLLMIRKDGGDEIIDPEQLEDRNERKISRIN
ncbi:hypothetical protein [Pseudomonas fluorescens]|uniref:Prophage PSSB64-02 n=2 Tax=Pseudomonas fluorescens TaxID=294 RepID=A0ABY1TE91_PSEFL|nr:hypothetical protein [Pseudomonas fluorescens]MCI4605337.1 hypothetical protein [Pseudomonas fluorescens]PQB00173.1 hypothetical protein B0A76_14080 [Pseudomonas fluorescens]RFP96766.1 hypothetical protein D0N73_07660 [Pseudomonas fluorescens]RMO68187.1 hypothetical protein ALQ35_03905 [Pseudomonas fluorescens]TWR48660.1 hypothetical protein FIP59_07305 [Pseudomonas fluorescens]